MRIGSIESPATEVYDSLKNNGLLRDYIVELYYVLHTQSREYIVEDIIRAMKERGILSCIVFHGSYCKIEHPDLSFSREKLDLGKAQSSNMHIEPRSIEYVSTF